MNFLRSFVLSVCLLILAAAAPVAYAQSEPPVAIAVAPASLELAPGQEGEIAVEARAARELYAFDVTLTFDPAAVTVVDSEPSRDGVQVGLGLFLDPGFVILNQADNQTGVVHVAMTQLSPSRPKSGAGPLVIVRLRANAASPLTLARAELARPDGSKLPVALSSGQVTIAQAVSAQPTATPLPTQVASLSMPTGTPEDEPAPPTATPAPTEATPEQGATVQASPTGPPMSTATAPIATTVPTNAPMPTDAPTTPTLALAPSDTPISPTMTATSAPTANPALPTATETRTEEVPSAATPTAVAIARADTTLLPLAAAPNGAPATRASPRSARLLLVAGGGLLALASILGALAAVVYLRGRR